MRSVSTSILALILSLCGCTNALLFYETGKLSITIEGRPDSSQPVQGSIGFKQRSAVVSPPLKKGEGAGDAGGMISSFRVSKEAGWDGAVTVNTALVTGDAADELSAGEVRKTARVVAGVPIDTYATTAHRAWDGAPGEQRTQIRSLACKPWEELTQAERQELGTLTQVGSGNYDREDFHEAVALEAGCSDKKE